MRIERNKCKDRWERYLDTIRTTIKNANQPRMKDSAKAELTIFDLTPDKIRNLPQFPRYGSAYQYKNQDSPKTHANPDSPGRKSYLGCQPRKISSSRGARCRVLREGAFFRGVEFFRWVGRGDLEGRWGGGGFGRKGVF